VNGALSRRWTLAGAATVVVLAATDLFLGRGVDIAGTLALPPFIAAFGASAPATAGLGAGAMVAAALLAAYNASAGAPTTVRLVTVAVAALAAPFLARQRERREQHLSEVEKVAEVAQLAVLTPVPGRAGPLRLASTYLSASKEALIGGDLYGVVTTPYGVRIVVADVKGKGLDAVRLAALVLSAFRETAGTARDLTAVATHVDEQVAPMLGDEDFVTAVFACVSDDGVLDLVNCGHPPPVLSRSGDPVAIMTAHPTAPIGLDPEPVNESDRLAEGDRLLFYTDGLVETRAKGGGFVSSDEALATIGTDPIDTALTTVVGRLRALASVGLRDDLALLLAEFCPSDLGAEAV
jgi:serine phosphatase RsbU (regulator of sigma subunit)